MHRILLSFIAAIAFGHAAPAFAAGCWISSTTLNASYDPLNPAPTMATGTYTLNCNRNTTDPPTLAYAVEMTGGTFASGGWQRVQKGGRYYNYNFYRTGSSSDPWGTGASGISGTVNFGSSTAITVTGTFYIILPAGQPMWAAGIYLDFVGIRVNGPLFTSSGTNTAYINITIPGGCALMTPPGNVTFSYTSFQAGTSSASTTFAVRCASGQPYTLSLDASGGTLLGLNYTLSIGPAASGTGTGALQTHAINGAIAGGQSGTCGTASCTGSQPRTMTVTF